MKGSFRWIVRSVAARFVEVGVLDHAARLSFYFLLSLFPILILAITGAGLIISRDQHLNGLVTQSLSNVAPGPALSLLRTTIQEIGGPTNTAGLSFALLLIVWSASRGTFALIEALNIVYRATETRKYWRRILRSTLVSGIAALLIITSMLLLLGGELLSQRWLAAGSSPNLGYAISGVNTLLLMICSWIAFSVIYHLLPCRRAGSWFEPGAWVAVLLWLLVSYGFKTYLGYFDTFSMTYGSISAVIVLLLWLYLSAAVVLVGALVNAEYEGVRSPKRNLA